MDTASSARTSTHDGRTSEPRSPRVESENIEPSWSHDRTHEPQQSPHQSRNRSGAERSGAAGGGAVADAATVLTLPRGVTVALPSAIARARRAAAAPFGRCGDPPELSSGGAEDGRSREKRLLREGSISIDFFAGEAFRACEGVGGRGGVEVAVAVAWR